MAKTNVNNIAPHAAQKGIDKKSQVKRATETTVNNDIEVLKESTNSRYTPSQRDLNFDIW